MALAEADSAGVPMPSVDVVRDRMITGIARGYADLDWSALGLIAAEEAGLRGLRPSRRNAGSDCGQPLSCRENRLDGQISEKEQDHVSSS